MTPNVPAEKITEQWDEVGFEELEERLELAICPSGYCQSNHCVSNYSS